MMSGLRKEVPGGAYHILLNEHSKELVNKGLILLRGSVRTGNIENATAMAAPLRVLSVREQDVIYRYKDRSFISLISSYLFIFFPV